MSIETVELAQAPPAVEVSDVSYIYSNAAGPVLKNLSVNFQAGAITGLIGRNGAGKTTLLGLLSNRLAPDSGKVLVGEQPVFENPIVAWSTCYVSANGLHLEGGTIRDNYRYLAELRYGYWDQNLADRLTVDFRLDQKAKVNTLSLGQRATFHAITGLSSRAPLTIFDEVHLGMDAPSRELFYQELLEDYVTHPRTVIFSSHLISEVEHLLEDVVIIHNGRQLLSGNIEDLKASHRSDSEPLTLQKIFIDLVNQEEV